MKKKLVYAINILLLICSTTVFTNCESYKTQSSGNTSIKQKQNESSYGTVDRQRGNVVLDCIGEGPTYNDAVKNALRNGIEETYGTFVSSNTSILNDNLIKDEVVSVTSGNVVAYKVVSKINVNNIWTVKVNAEISQGKLIQYAKSKGASVEINTSTYAMNVILDNLNKKNQEKIKMHNFQIFKETLPFCFDYKIEVSEPHKSWLDGDLYEIDLKVIVVENDNCRQLNELIGNGLYSNLAGDLDYKRFTCHQREHGYKLYCNGQDITRDKYGYTFRKVIKYGKSFQRTFDWMVDDRRIEGVHRMICYDRRNPTSNAITSDEVILYYEFHLTLKELQAFNPQFHIEPIREKTFYF